jgi:enoyl-CoA hydratase/carnithine racemase
MTAELKSSQQGQTLILTLSNPDFRNALGPEIYAKGMQVLQDAAGSDAVRSIVITGEGANFCAGGNLNRILENRKGPRSVQEQSIEKFHAWVQAIRACPKPVIAAVEGAAAGAGFSLALTCDLIVAARDAVFVMAYTSVALSPDGGGSWHLARVLPPQLANELMMLGEKIGAPRLHELGVVNRMAEPGLALQDALTLAGRLNQRAPNAIASVKSLSIHAPLQDLGAQLAQERDAFVNNLHNANGLEGVSAFLEKRPAKYV